MQLEAGDHRLSAVSPDEFGGDIDLPGSNAVRQDEGVGARGERPALPKLGTAKPVVSTKGFRVLP